MNRPKGTIYTYTIDYHSIIFYKALKKGLISVKKEYKPPIQRTGTY
jgi:hypothetical protein